MAERTYRVTLRFEQVQEKHLPALIEAMRKGGRVLHADAMLIVGDTPPPAILLYGEDLIRGDKEK